MKTKLASLAILALALLGNVNSASAECVYGCPGPGGSFSPPSPGHSGLTIPPPMHQQPSTFSIKGSGFHQGSGTGFANGDQGFAKTELGGGNNVSTTFNAYGNLCPGTNCTSGNYTFKGSSWQGVDTTSGAISQGGRAVASAGNGGYAEVGLGFTKH